MLHGHQLTVWTEFNIERAFHTIEQSRPLNLPKMPHTLHHSNLQARKYCQQAVFEETLSWQATTRQLQHGLEQPDISNTALGSLTACHTLGIGI